MGFFASIFFSNSSNKFSSLGYNRQQSKKEPESVSKLSKVVEVEFPRIAPLRFVRVIYTDVGCRCAIHLAMAAIISDEQRFDATILCFLGFQTHFHEELL